MSSSLHDRRHLVLEGAYNMRDLGHVSTADGHAVKHGKLFRADALHKLTAADLEVLGDFGIRTVVDLRSIGEIKSTGPARLTEQGARHLHKPLMSSDPADTEENQEPMTLGQVYTMLAKNGPDRFVDAVETLATAENQPAVFHCAAGKDRTGITAALIYSILGVDREVIIEDYVLTEANMERMVKQLIADRPELASTSTAQNYHHRYARAEDATIRTFLGELDAEFGSPVAWLKRNGLRKSSIENLRSEMLG